MNKLECMTASEIFVINDGSILSYHQIYLQLVNTEMIITQIDALHNNVIHVLHDST